MRFVLFGVGVGMLCILSSGPASAGSRDARKAARALEDANDDADRGCRRAIGDDLEDLVDDLSDRPSRRELAKIVRKLEDLHDDARDECSRSVARGIADALEVLDGGDDDDRDRDRDRRRPRFDCWSKSDPGCEMTRDGHPPMDRKTFTSFLSTLSTESNGLVKEEMCERMFADHYLTVAQLIAVLKKFHNGLTKLEVVKSAASHVVDSKNAFQLKSSFHNSITGSEAVEAVSKAKSRTSGRQRTSGRTRTRGRSNDDGNLNFEVNVNLGF